jgi:hypothetical protein
MARTVRQSVCNELRNEFKNIDLERVFTRDEGVEEQVIPLPWSEIKDTIRSWVLSTQEKYLVEDTRFSVEYVYPEYQREIDVTIDWFINDCLRYGILRRTFHGRYELVEADPTVFESEREGIRIQCEWEKPYTVYRHRMNTSGRIDVKANGDPAIDSVTSQDPLAY